MKRLIILSAVLLIITLINKACGDHPKAENSLVRLQSQSYRMDLFQSSRFHPSKNNISVKSWELHLERLEFSGKQKNGEPYFFSTTYDGVLASNKDKERPDHFVEFGVPGGTYNPFEITFHTGGNDTPAALIIESEFHLPQKDDTIDVEFRFFSHKETFALKVKQAKKSGQVQFKKGRINHIRCGIDRDHLFRELDPAEINELVRKRSNDEEKIIVSAQTNPKIYSTLKKRVYPSIHAFLQ